MHCDRACSRGGRRGYGSSTCASTPLFAVARTWFRRKRVLAPGTAKRVELGDDEPVAIFNVEGGDILIGREPR